MCYLVTTETVIGTFRCSQMLISWTSGSLAENTQMLPQTPLLCVTSSEVSGFGRLQVDSGVLFKVQLSPQPL